MSDSDLANNSAQHGTDTQTTNDAVQPKDGKVDENKWDADTDAGMGWKDW